MPFPVGRIKVIVYDLRTGEMIREHDTNFSIRSDRDWLTQISVWAWSNGYSVETLNYEDRNLPIETLRG